MSVSTVKYTFQGQVYDLTYNSDTGKYEATVPAPSKSSYSQPDHKYGGTIAATDDAGNTTVVNETHSTLGESLKIRVLEKVAPVIVITYPTVSAYITDANPEVVFKVTDDDSGVNPDTIKLTVDGQEVDVVKTAVADGYECTYTPETPLADGEHTISVTASDNDGNAAAAKSATFTVDTVPPTLSITGPTEGLITNEEEITVTGTTNDATSKPVVVTVNGESVSVNEDGSFSKVITLTSGANVITIVATDQAGKATTVTRNVTLDTGAPVIQSITLTPNPIDAGKTFIISVEVTD